ncbi:MAG TPA: type VI secretion system baseplate subunit TssG [Candidatus Nanopelagicales bacterium]|nr:type VI secretion system baseplate subunit TssG [Candidatus Nanopelagicales bacterium]
MGAEERKPDVDLSIAFERFRQDARRFSFFRLVYLLERLFPATPPVGRLGPASEERIRLRSDPSLTFASSDVSEVELVKYGDGAERARISVTFMGLYGATSALPTHFAEDIALAEFQGGPQPIRELLDVLHHRILALFYRTWAKYRLPVTYRRGGADAFTSRMFCSVGVDGFRPGSQTPVDRFFFLRYASILASKSRSARGLEVVLKDMFGDMGIQIEQFVGHWTLIEKPNRNKLGVQNHQLGQSLTIGRYVYDGSGRFNIHIGPVSYDDYLSLLPGGHRQPILRGIIDTFTPGMHDVMLEISVKTEDAPRYQLGSARAATLKRTTWLGGSAGQQFKISVPLEGKQMHRTEADDEDEDLGEPPPM